MSKLNTWVSIPNNSDFSIHNLPFGVFSIGNSTKSLGIAIGAHIVDLHYWSQLGCFKEITLQNDVFAAETLNNFISLGKTVTNAIRNKVQEILCNPESPLKNDPRALVAQSEATMHLPVAIGDYTDFYSSIEHATNVGKMFRDPANALLPNWRHLPVGYHGRASSIVVSGTPIRRPHGQVLPKGEEIPVFQASARLDFELEMAFIIGKESALGDTISTTEAEDYIFGMVLFNDWSARDIQQWEYVPLGPFLGKNFGSSISPWVVTLEALAPFRVQGPAQEPQPLPYLESAGMNNYDIALEVAIQPEDALETIVSRSNFKYMYWNMAQQLAHHTVNGCNVRVGDMMASGTISGHTEDSYGSMLELSWMGTKPLKMADGSERTFIRNNDTVIMRGAAARGDVRVGFGEVSGKIC
ncbi:MAG: fumarylacetoacetase [Bacteroidota bacterium]|jgi:fumarylacetoacetase